ncbi:response regulator [Phenylobacterium sp.]|uniref:response regulator n=1 Tax=Phenylobacterium sp. TaxID=1871053 RepID=UPI0025DE3BED|nr:response regulator [Phenylobacterium sp.]MBX3483304.1 response regulator [Phenylobacterium sp.]MCW5761146.1 response regulator [Phenylobacterium sp.]
MSLPEFFSDRVTAEIRQQMEGVMALTGQLARQRLTPDGEACVASVAEAAETVLRVMGAGLDLKSVHSRGVTLELEPVRLREVMDELQDRWQPRAAAGGVTLLVAYDGDPDAAAMADRKRLLQVFDGFIGEAVAAQARGAVEATLRAHADDNGGIRLEGRVRGPRDTAWDGMDLDARIMSIEARLGLEVALGAMLARSILDGMQGELRKEHNAGASDTVAFEIRLAPVAETVDETPTEDAGRAAHILVVDDNATNRMVAQSLVEMFDCTSEAAEDGEEAVEAARSGRFDLILMDIKMPRMDGVAATRAIRALGGPIARTPIIALTANADPEDAEGYLAAGMNGVVEKPMKPEHLLQALQNALSPPDEAAAA